jgi:hypothetical protein
MMTDQQTKVVLIYRRDAEPDQTLVKMLEEQLSAADCEVFVDRHLTMGVEWAKEIEARIRRADAVVPLLSTESIYSEMLGFEIETAHEAAQLNQGLPRILPIRVNYTGPLPEPVSSIVDPIQYFLWEGNQDDLGLSTELLEVIKHLPHRTRAAEPEPGQPAIKKAAAVSPERTPGPLGRPAALESLGGAVPLNSEFYVERISDAELNTSIANRDSIVLIKGARQMGKTSLLARGLQQARTAGIKAVSTDLQKFNADSFKSVNALYLSLAASMVDQLELEVSPADIWEERRGPNANFERFMRRAILSRVYAPLVWGLDEVDRLFATPYGTDMFGLLRSWHNERALDPSGPWSTLTIVIAYATEAHLFITDMNQSPFNVGTRLMLEDFSLAQVEDLNRRYRQPLRDDEELSRFFRLVGGQPYLVRRGLHEMSKRQLSFEAFEDLASRDESFYGDHLRRALVLLVRDAEMSRAMRGLLHGEPCPNSDTFDRLRSASLVIGHTPEDARPRCRLYTSYLRRHLK